MMTSLRAIMRFAHQGAATSNGAFAGLPEGVTTHAQLLGAFKAAAPCLGLPPRMVHVIDWLFRFTMAQDWGRGGRPIVWPSASPQQEAFGLSESRVKILNRGLIEAGLVTMKDSPNGKRYGKCDARGNIVEAYGFDLSPPVTRNSSAWRLRPEPNGSRWDVCAAAPRSGATASRRSSKRRRVRISRRGMACPQARLLRHEAGAEEGGSTGGSDTRRGEPGTAAAFRA
jgi:replication initiation protein RepC